MHTPLWRPNLLIAQACCSAVLQVKVWLGEERLHYYVLSRFLVSRSLTVTKIPHLKAVKIALELKKFCVDNGMLDICQVIGYEALTGSRHAFMFHKKKPDDSFGKA